VDFLKSFGLKCYVVLSTSLTNLTHDAIRQALNYLDVNGFVDFSDFDGDGDGFVDSIAFGLPHVTVQGDSSRFHKSEHKFLQESPEATWDEVLGESLSPVATRMCLLKTPPSKNGPFGNWQWLVVRCVGSLKKEKECMPRDGPNSPPPENHRYVFVLFQHAGEVKKPSGPPKEWNFYHFVKDDKDSLKPVALNFFWCD
jgi:hypothetical protein